MQPPPAPTSFESDTLNAYQYLSQIRLRSAILSTPVASCIDKCTDLHALGSGTAKLKSMNHVKEEEKEKKCLEFCALKWDELHRRSMQVLTKKEITGIQTEMFNEMRKSAQAQFDLLQK